MRRSLASGALHLRKAKRGAAGGGGEARAVAGAACRGLVSAAFGLVVFIGAASPATATSVIAQRK